jgi:penicillin-binding protein 2
VDTIARYSGMFGLGRSTGLNLGGERPGLIPTRDWKLERFGVPWQPGETISVSIGQSFVLMTPIQAARMMAAVFNGGVLHEPAVVRWVGKNDRTEYMFEPRVASRLDAAPENLERLRKALVAVVNEQRGTGGRARVEGVTVAGKTGTAQVVALDAGKAAEEAGEVPEKFRDHAWFVAAAPAENPRLAVAVLLENSGQGGKVAAPVAGRIIRAYLGVETAGPGRQAARVP